VHKSKNRLELLKFGLAAQF